MFAPISLGAFFHLFFFFFLFSLFLTAVHLTLGEDLFTAYCSSVAAEGQRWARWPLFLCALRHLSQLTAVYLPVEAMERAGSRLINSSVSN
ncbi:hypothetical protein BDA96_04G097700 [Sorghum bicolor]|uniref:Secreted protein n=2 Tax=Sorghum bicolor TaxID=4558 RepID=A0A921R1P9_SORBI|nr:hypothetical protein BDA96_04G097700 [Sorghum bicolor]OQU84629.1 hypothetical protein SORBI_3004G089801 [Sorghum bicolor]